MISSGVDAGGSQTPRSGTSRWILAAVIVLLACAVSYVLGLSGSVARGADDEVKRPDRVTLLSREIADLRQQVAVLRKSNSSLGSQVQMLTERHGVLDQIIEHLKTLKADNQALVGLIAPRAAGTPDGPGDDQGAPTITEVTRGYSDHVIVTPSADERRQAAHGGTTSTSVNADDRQARLQSKQAER